MREEVKWLQPPGPRLRRRDLSDDDVETSNALHAPSTAHIHHLSVPLLLDVLSRLCPGGMYSSGWRHLVVRWLLLNTTGFGTIAYLGPPPAGSGGYFEARRSTVAVVLFVYSWTSLVARTEIEMGGQSWASWTVSRGREERHRV